jgi:hypothetical protein
MIRRTRRYNRRRTLSPAKQRLANLAEILDVEARIITSGVSEQLKYGMTAPYMIDVYIARLGEAKEKKIEADKKYDETYSNRKSKPLRAQMAKKEGK